MQKDRNQDRWVKHDMMFICDGRGYCIAPTGAAVCVGPVDDYGNPLDKNQLLPEGVVNDATIPPKSAEIAKNHVTKIKHEGKYADVENDVFLLQPKKRGRPQKNGDDVCRMTKWRRQKKEEEEKQGVLL